MGKTLDNYKNSFLYHIPWDFLYNNFILINKNMGFQVTLKIENHDLDFFTEEEINLKILQYNNAIKKLPDNFIIHYEVQRKKSKGYIDTNIDKEIIPTFLIENERKNLFLGNEYFQCDYYITLTYLISEDAENKISSLLSKNRSEKIDEKIAEETEKELKQFRQKVASFISLLKYATTSIEVLEGEKLMAYMYSTVNAEFPERKKMPKAPMYPIDQYLSNSNFETGSDTKIQRLFKTKHLRTISINLFPDEIESRVLRKLESLDFEFRMSARYIVLSQSESKKMLKNFFIFHQGKQKNFGQYITEAITKKPSFNIDEVELAKTEEARMALNEFKEGGMSYGYYTFTIILVDENLKRLEDNALKIITIFDEEDFTSSIDKYNVFPSYLGAIPGNLKANIRKYPINSMLLSCLFPTSSMYKGEELNKHFEKQNTVSVPLMTTKTNLNDIFYFNLHVEDVGHTLVVGPTGSGKSVLLGEIAAEFKKYPNAQIFFFDKGGSIRVLTACVGGKFYDLGKGGENDLSFQPLAKIHLENEKSFASNWIISLLEQENIIINPDMKSVIWETLTTLSNDPVNRRTMSNFVFTVMNKEIQQALEPYTKIGAYGKYFDNNEDNFSQESNWQAFEMGQIIKDPKATAPILSYIFHRIETEFLSSDKPTLIFVDEAWFALQNEYFISRFDDWLRTLRKLNATIIFATQSLNEIADSPITPAIIDGCKTKVLLPSPQAKTYWKGLYSKFGLNSIEIERVSQGEMKKQYFYKSDLGSREFEMELSKIELAYVGSSSSSDQKKIQEICESTKNLKEINLKWLEYKLGGSKEFIKYKKIIGGI